MKREKTIYALGFFDGVHVGHQALLAACRDLAAQTGAKAGVVTFEDHPETLVLGQAPKLINSIEDRCLLLRQQGMETIVTMPFDEKLRSMPWQDFFRLLTEEYGAAGLVCGTDFRFGYRGEGTADKLRSVCEAAGIPCAVVPEQSIDGVRVSSTHIRQLIENGEMETAVKFLGHPHILTGTVVKGQQLGRKIGIPTANLAVVARHLVPKFGVYACRIHTEFGEFSAVTNVGTRPTVAGNGVTVEPWILDFDGDLYGQTVELAFYRFLRPEQKFESLADLQAEILKNASQTRDFFAKN